MHPQNSQGGIATRFGAWLKMPFSGDMDTLHWFLFLGLLLCILFLWSRIMHYIVEGAKAV